MLTEHLNLDAKFSSEVVDLYLDFVMFIVTKVDEYSQVALDILKIF